MSYSAIPPFTHGQQIDAAPLAQLAANLDEIHARLGDVATFQPTPAAVAGEDNDAAYFVHLYRWLWVSGDAQIEDPAEVGEPVGASSGDSEPTRIDLRSVPWLFPGKIYRVTGCSYSIETAAP